MGDILLINVVFHDTDFYMLVIIHNIDFGKFYFLKIFLKFFEKFFLKIFFENFFENFFFKSISSNIFNKEYSLLKYKV